jgi:four helix bundle protein
VSNYHNLKAWQHARRLAVESARAARQLPRHEQAVLGTQLRQAAYSVAAKIAAGSVASGAARLAAFDAARRSLAEIETILSVAHDLEYLPTSDYARLEAWCVEATKTLCGLERKLRAPAGSARTHPAQ